MQLSGKPARIEIMISAAPEACKVIIPPRRYRDMRAQPAQARCKRHANASGTDDQHRQSMQRDRKLLHCDLDGTLRRRNRVEQCQLFAFQIILYLNAAARRHIAYHARHRTPIHRLARRDGIEHIRQLIWRVGKRRIQPPARAHHRHGKQNDIRFGEQRAGSAAGFQFRAAALQPNGAHLCAVCRQQLAQIGLPHVAACQRKGQRVFHEPLPLPCLHPMRPARR